VGELEGVVVGGKDGLACGVGEEASEVKRLVSEGGCID